MILLMMIGIGGESFQTNLIELYYRLHTAAITQEFCINKNKPQMHCNGQCHLAKELKKATQPVTNNTNSNKNFKNVELFVNHSTAYISQLISTISITYPCLYSLLTEGFTNACFHPPTLSA